MHFFQNPGRKPHGRVGERICNGLRLGALQVLVTTLVFAPPLSLGKKIRFSRRKRCIFRRQLRTDAARNKAQVDGWNCLRVPVSQVGGRISAPVATTREELRISQDIVHQLINNVSGTPDAHSWETWSIRVAIARKRGYQDVETVARVSSMSSGIGQQRYDLQHLRKRTRPAMNKDQRNGIRSFAFLMNEMKPEALDRRAEMAELVQPGFLQPPIKPLAPIHNEFHEITEIRALRPSCNMRV